MGSNIGTIRGTIEIDYDGAGIVRAVKDTEKMNDSGNRLDKTMTGILKTFRGFVAGAAKVAAASLLTHSALQAVAATLAILGPLVGAGLAVLPGIAIGAAAAIGILKVATSGVSDALKAATEDTDKFNKAIEGLSPNAQKFAKAYRAALPVLNSVKKAIQDAFFKGTVDSVTRLVLLIRFLRAQAVGVAGAMGQLAKELVRVVTTGQNADRLQVILSGVTAFLLKMRGAITPIVDGFLSMAAQAAVFGGTVGGVVNNAFQKLGAFLKGVNLQDLFAKAAPIVQSLGVFLGNVATIASQLFTVFNVDGANAAGILGELAGKLAEFLQSAEGQAALAAIGQAMQAISTGAGQVFLTLLQALAPTIVALAPAITELANTLTSLLVPAIVALTPALVATATWISNNTDLVFPLLAAIVAIAAAYKTYIAVKELWVTVEKVAQALHLKAIALWIRDTAVTVANTAVTAANAALRAGAFLASWIVTTAAMIAQRIAMVAIVVWSNIVRAATIAWTIVQIALSVAINSTFIIIIVVIAVIAALVAAIIWLWKNNETFRTIVLAVWNGIKAGISAVVDALVATWNALVIAGKAIFNGLKIFFTAIWNAIAFTIQANIDIIRTVVVAVFNFIRAYLTTVFNVYRTIAVTVWNAIVAVIKFAINTAVATIKAIGQVVAIVRNAFNSAKSAASTAISGLISLVKEIPGKVASALGNVGRLLYDKGRSLIQGFIDGIKSMIDAAKNAVGSVVGAVSRFLPGSPAKEGPLSGRGYVLLRAQRFMADFAKGINGTSQMPVDALRGAIRPIVTVPPLQGGVDRVRAQTRVSETTPATFGPYQMTVDGKVLSSFVIDAVSGNPIPVAAAAREGNRQNSWTNTGRS